MIANFQFTPAFPGGKQPVPVFSKFLGNTIWLWTLDDSPLPRKRNLTSIPAHNAHLSSRLRPALL